MLPREWLKGLMKWRREQWSATVLADQNQLLIQQLLQSREQSMCLMSEAGTNTCLKASTKPPGPYIVSIVDMVFN